MGLILQKASEGINEGTAVIIAAIVGAVVSTVLQSFGAFLSDRLATRREERRSAREDKIRQEQWDRDDKLRREEQEQERTRRRKEEEREEHQFKVQERIRVYKSFIAATTFDLPILEENRPDVLHRLNETFTEVQLHASDFTQEAAQKLYEAAIEAAAATSWSGETTSTHLLGKEREAFWSEARDELYE